MLKPHYEETLTKDLNKLSLKGGWIAVNSAALFVTGVVASQHISAAVVHRASIQARLHILSGEHIFHSAH